MNIKAKIAQIQKVEKAARAAQARRDAAQTKWEKLYDEVKETPEWAEFCESINVCGRYNFGDIIS